MTDDITVGLDTALQPPMANGEVVFEAPWQSRVFAMAVSLHESGLFPWSEFQTQLIDVIARADARPDDGEYAYFDHFAAALQELLLKKGVLDSAALDARATEFADRPHGHDH